MADDKICLVVTVVYLDAPIAIQNILEVLVDLSHLVATLALGSRPRQRGCKGAGQREARESRQGLPGV
jgi:hypothetical protein